MNSILLVLLILLGVALGGAIGWLLAAGRTRTELVKSQVDAEGRIKAAEGTLQEVRARVGALQASLDDRERVLEGFQQKLREESEQKVKAQTELENARTAAEDSKQLRERLKVEGELRVAAETKLRETQTSLEEQKKLLEEAKKTLTQTFQALSAEALKSNNQAFIALARSQFETLQAQAKGDLETRQKAIDGLVAPLKESLGRYEHQILEMEKTRQKAYGTLDEQLRTLAQANKRLEEETKHLASALSSPLKARGRWGELTLRRVVELAGMSEHCDFSEQESITTESGRQRPDMIVNLPGNRRIAVDAKVPLQAFLDAVNPEKSEEERAKALATHGQLVRSHMNQLAERKYWEQVGPELELVVLFLPGESFFSAALEQDRQLIDDGMQKKVVLATPTTLIALLRSAAYLWQQEKITQNAKEISELGRELYDRLKTFLGHFQTLGSSLERAVESYNKAVGSMESRVLVSARKFKELGAATGGEIPELEPVDEVPRTLEAPEKELEE
ncbi:MAG: DNA recombination protein RmuC [Terriglobia bacterium]|jgi:DNA recombination protein RmuC